MSKFNVIVLTIFPELFPGPLGVSVIGNALRNNTWSLKIKNIRDFATDKYKTVDDYPAGGGAGMVFKADVLSKSIDNAKKHFGKLKHKIIYLSPRGKLLNQRIVKRTLSCKNLILICGRFEGIDQRVIDHHNIEELSIGDYIISGGETAAFVLIDSCVRLIPGVLGKQSSIEEESFATDTEYENLLEYDQYTKPRIWQGHKTPDVLLNGHHKEIKEWRLKNAQSRTKRTRPDLWSVHSKKK